MYLRNDGSPVELPRADRHNCRFQVADFVAWSQNRPERFHQVAAAILSSNGFSQTHIRALREFPGVHLTKPTEFYREFDRLKADRPRGYVSNLVFETLLKSWIIRDRRIVRKRLRAVAAMTLHANGFSTEQIATVLGWQAKGSVSRAMQSAREQIAELFDSNSSSPGRLDRRKARTAENRRRTRPR